VSVTATTGTGLPEEDFEYLRELMHVRAAIVLDRGKEYLALSRLEPVARDHGLTTVSELVAKLRTRELTSAMHDQVVDALTTNETTFFRDVHPFESLRTHILPNLIERKRLSRSLSIWSAGCSSGQEPFSVAMLIREHFPELATWQISILGTDVSIGMLERACEGRYGQMEVNRGLPASLLVRYFRRVGLGWQIDESIRGMVRFQHQNLIDPWPALPPVDLVLMRNVMIYFDMATKQAILARVRDALAPHGYLLLGTSETTLHLAGSFERHAVGPTGWYRRKQAVPVAAAQTMAHP
jgi:chemotaxis protein methyltransferase CheR